MNIGEYAREDGICVKQAIGDSAITGNDISIGYIL